jgi:hypothetical protein
LGWAEREEKAREIGPIIGGFIRRNDKRGFIINHTREIKIGFIANNFGFSQNMQGERCMMP